jgi:hypothetical protein
LQYAIQQVCLYMHAPRDYHWTAVKWILRYIRGTLDLGLTLRTRFSSHGHRRLLRCRLGGLP